MVPTIFIKFCGFIVHSKPNNVTLSAFPEKIPETEKNVNFSVYRRLTERLTQLTNLVQFRYVGPLQISPFPFFFHFRLTVKIKRNSHKKKLNI